MVSQSTIDAVQALSEAPSRYYIVFPCGDRSRLTVVEIQAALDYEIHDYSVASSKDFPSDREAADHAKKLAKEHGLTFEGDSQGMLD